MKVTKFLFSSGFMGILFAVFAVAMAMATFVENDYGSASAYSTVYNTWWFELILLLLAVNLVGQMIIFKLYKKEKLPVFLFHLSFVVMIIGAGITRYCRDPDDIKVLFLVTPMLAETEAEACAKRDRLITSPRFIEQRLALISSITDIDFSQFALDAPLPRLTTNGEQGSLDRFAQWGSGKTLRQLVGESIGGVATSDGLTGTPDQVAERMHTIMEEVGGDGFLFRFPQQRINRHYIREITEGLVPALQRRGLTRTAYTKPTLRETLREF
jgi:hypothetical protein